ncbi:hypothetical protein M3Y97_00677900 [Aphelenchoides bicaudatus]|nr:hypothetical protein M3Y97_00677900 [Aphelenchoides bicaudatus]
MTDVIATPSFDQKRRDGSTATFHSASSFDMNPDREGTLNAGASATNLDGIEVHDVGTSTPGVKHNFSAQTDALSSTTAPKYEAFVMTGDKILNLNPKISPSYAKVQRRQLPPNVEVQDNPNYPRAFENFPSTHYQKRKNSKNPSTNGDVSASNSEQILNNDHRFNNFSAATTELAEPCASTNEICINPPSSTNSIQRIGSLTRDRRLNSLSREAETIRSKESNDSDTNLISITQDISQLRPLPIVPSTYNYTGLRIDAALRNFLEHVNLVGESSERARILKHFADRYYECNPTLFDGPDAIHALACALLLLNTDLHGNITSKKMTMPEFIDNLAYTNFNYDRGLLKTLYAKVKSQPFKSNEPPPEKPRPRMSNAMLANQFARQITDQVDYFRGWVMLKEVYDRDGKKTPFGRRQWKMYFATVRGLTLYLHKNERGFDGSRFAVFQNCIRLHHALAEIPHDYTKKSHVFRVTTAKLGEYLLQTSSPEELHKWINAINFVAASLSTPALPESLGSHSKAAHLKLSPLPNMVSNLSIREQLQHHREKMAEMQELLNGLRETAPSLKARGKPVYNYFYRERFIERELLRYKTYVESINRNLSPSSRPDSRNNLNSVMTN